MGCKKKEGSASVCPFSNRFSYSAGSVPQFRVRSGGWTQFLTTNIFTWGVLFACTFFNAPYLWVQTWYQVNFQPQTRDFNHAHLLTACSIQHSRLANAYSEPRNARNEPPSLLYKVRVAFLGSRRGYVPLGANHGSLQQNLYQCTSRVTLLISSCPNSFC